jgi:hypothetical protein
MANDHTSLLERAAQQPELLSSAEMDDDVFAENEPGFDGEYTAERLFARQPEKYRLVVSLLAERLGILKIARLLKPLHPATVMAVRDREGVAIEIEKKELARLCHHGAHLALEGVVEDMADPARRNKVGARDKAVIAAVCIDKGQLLSGEATSRLELTEINLSEHDALNDYIAGLRRAQTGLEGGNLAQKGAAAGTGFSTDRGASDGSRGVSGDRPGIDVESTATPPQPIEEQQP